MKNRDTYNRGVVKDRGKSKITGLCRGVGSWETEGQSVPKWENFDVRGYVNGRGVCVSGVVSRLMILLR